MTVRLLLAILAGLPESSEVKFVRKGKLCDVSIVGVTRTQDLPDIRTLRQTRAYHSIHESIVLTDKPALEHIAQDMPIKTVWTYLPGKEAV